MFRFTIRDLLWLTLVVAVALGSWIDRQRSRVGLEQAQSRATKWRAIAGTLEHALEEDGCTVGLLDLGEGPTIWAYRSKPGHTRYWPLDFHEPSLEDD
jgi:hypothetical protein